MFDTETWEKLSYHGKTICDLNHLGENFRGHEILIHFFCVCFFFMVFVWGISLMIRGLGWCHIPMTFWIFAGWPPGFSCVDPFVSFVNPMTDPWDWYISLHEWLIFMANVGKLMYHIHGSYGKILKEI